MLTVTEFTAFPSANFLSSFNVLKKLNFLTLRMVNMNARPSLCHCLPLIRHLALYKCVLIDCFLIDLVAALGDVLSVQSIANKESSLKWPIYYVRIGH